MRTKKEAEFSRRYFKELEKATKVGMRSRARRHQLLKARHTKDDERLWPDIMRLLEQHSPRGAKHYVKRREIIRLPDGVFAKWAADPGECILEVMQRTGSHVQVVPTKELGLFSSLTLLGKPAQNHAAKRLLQGSNLLQAVSEDDIHASRSIADYELRSEISDRYSEATGEADNAEENEAESDNKSDNKSDDLDVPHLQAAVEEAIGRVPTRAVWSAVPVKYKHVVPKENEGGDSEVSVKAPSSRTQNSAVSLTARIEELTVDACGDKPRTGKPVPDRTGSVREELVSLLTNPEHSTLITPVALGLAMNYLAHHMHFPSVRGILDALKDTKLHIDANIFNPLLAAAAQAENVVAFHYVVQAMRERKVAPDADTWIQFHVLMLKRFPAQSKQVIARMKAHAIESDLSAKIDNIESYSAALLESFMQENPNATIKQCIESMNEGMPGLKWFTTFTANVMCSSLLKKGKMVQALSIVDELVRNGGRPDTVTLNTFLSCARKDGNMEMAVAILRKFHDLHAKSFALAAVDKHDKPIKLSRDHKLSVALNRASFKILCDIAWDHKQYNCLRVFYRYACCAGLLHNSMKLKISTSSISPGALNFKPRFIFNDDKQGTVGARGRLWQALSAKFAMNVPSGLQPKDTNPDTASDNDPPLPSDHISTPEDPPSTVTHVPESPPKDAPKTQAKKEAAKALLRADVNEVHSLRPVQPLAEMAEVAWQTDKLWKRRLLGLPAGLRPCKYGEGMFDVMVKEGVRVAVEKGDVTPMEL